MIRVEGRSFRNFIRLRYRDYLSLKRPNIFVDVEYKGFLKAKNLRTSVFQKELYRQSINNNPIVLHLCFSGQSSLAILNPSLNKVKFYTADHSGKIFSCFLPILFSLILPQNGALMLHACGVADNKKGYLFIAPPEGGKSTVGKLALRYGLSVLNDERIIIRREGKLFKIYGNPWHGDIKETSNAPVPIKHIFFLKKSNANQIKPINKKKAAMRILKNSFYLPVDKKLIKKIIAICFDMVYNINHYELSFKAGISMWRFLDAATDSGCSEK